MDRNLMEKNRGGGNKPGPGSKQGEQEPKTANPQGRRDLPHEPRRDQAEPTRERPDQQQPPQQPRQEPRQEPKHEPRQAMDRKRMPMDERSDEESIGRPVQLTREPES